MGADGIFHRQNPKSRGDIMESGKMPQILWLVAAIVLLGLYTVVAGFSTARNPEE